MSILNSSCNLNKAENLSDLPGPNLLQLLKLFLLDNNRDPLELFTSLKQRYGKAIHLKYIPDLGNDTLLLSDPDAMESILLENQKEFGKPDTPVTNDVKKIMGNGLLTTDGEIWREHHRLLMPHFQDDSIANMVPIALEVTEKIIERWSSNSFHQPFDLFQEMKILGLRFISRALFSRRLKVDEVENIKDSIDVLRDAYRRRRTSPVTAPFWFPTPNNQRSKGARDELHKFANRIVAQRRTNDIREDDMLQTLIDACYEDNSLTLEDIRNEIVTFIIAGYTTTAAAMGWAIYLLLNHPSHYERIRSESANVWTRDNLRSILHSIPYANAVFKETLRIYPTAPWIARSNQEQTILKGIRLPAKTTIIMSPYLLHHDSSLFENPEEFRPERFSEDEVDDQFYYLPFSVGAHQCIGREIALMEGPLVLSKIFSEGQIKKTIETPDKVSIHTAVNIEPDRAIPVKFSTTDSN